MTGETSNTVNDRQAGFVLLPVLLVMGLLASLALVISFSARSDTQDMALAQDLAWARLNADNALVRGIVALGDPSDPLHPTLLRPAEPLDLVINGVPIRLSLEHESGKVDLNRSNPNLLRSAIAATFADQADATFARIMAVRASGRFMDDLNVLLSPGQQYTIDTNRIGKLFTVLTGTSGISPTLASPDVLTALPGLSPDELRSLMRDRHSARFEQEAILLKYRDFFSPPRPIYTLRATIQERGLPPVTRSVVFAIAQLPLRRASDLAVLAWR